ncbi:MAG: ATP-binding protein, partial [Dehalococcoidia bacterium]|nr:ATP-binding protein [Dehalococcoidia bacterium]
PENSGIILRAFVKEGSLAVEVEDHGKGISKEEQAQLFQAYHRVEEDRHLTPVLGLGLTLSKQIVEAHGGRIGVESEPGKGSIFRFTTPLRTEQPI